MEDRQAVESVFQTYKPEKVVTLQRKLSQYSIENPAAYIQANLVGFGHILEGCRHHKVQHLVYASSSSVYGGNSNSFLRESGRSPISLYAASKKANE